MDIKGTAVKATPDYIKKYHADKYRDWLAKLPAESRKIMNSSVYATSWYPLYESVVMPTYVLGQMLYDSPEDAAMKLGRYSAELSLNGIYKIFVRVSSPAFVLGRASNVFSTYYRNAEIKVAESSSKHATMEFKGFSLKDKLIIHRIAGWIQATLEVVQKSNINTQVSIKPVDDTYIVASVKASWD